jgi:hypothetical protein
MKKLLAFLLLAANFQAFSQTNTKSPQPISPANGAVIIPSQVLFKWTPLVPRPTGTVTYRLRVWQLMQGQNNAQAMKANQPIFDKDYDNAMQATVSNVISGPCKPPYMCDFIWNIQAINKNGPPSGIEYNMTSDAFKFSIHAENEVKKDK